MTRVRYIKTNNLLINTKPILCNHRFVNVILNTNDMTYNVIDANNEKEVIIEGVQPSIHQLKRKVKECLKSIGASFLDEVRNTHKQRKLIIETTDNRMDSK